MTDAQSFLKRMWDYLQKNPTARDKTAYIVIVDIVSVYDAPQIHIVTFNHTNQTMNFTGDSTEGHMDVMLENLSGMAGHYLRVEKWTSQ